jgi:hydroxypyruvate isomerase
MRFDANISILFPDLPLLRRPAAAAAEGFDAIEAWWPFDREVPAAADVDRFAEAVGETGVRVVSLNFSTGDPAAGEHGLLSLPAERSRFRDNADAASEVARRVGATVLNAHYGNVGPGFVRSAGDDAAVESLAYAAARAGDAGASVVIEALNPADFPRYGLHRIEDAIALADRVLAETGATIGVLFDVYHVQRAQGDLLARIEAFAGRFGHVQVADAPSRHRPGTGEIAFERVLPALERAGYAGFVGLEYRPSLDPLDTFAWLPREQRASRPPLPGGGAGERQAGGPGR